MKFLVIPLLYVIQFSNGAPSDFRSTLIKTKNVGTYEAIDLQDVHFYLYTRGLNGNYSELKIGDVNNLKSSGFSAERPTKIAIHGWHDDAFAGNSILSLKSAFLESGDVNFIAVDWSSCAGTINYFHAMSCVKDVGHFIGDLIHFLRNETGLKNEDVHVMGHSIGAHACGFVADKFPDEKIKRITGFDPAGPIYEVEGPLNRLDKTDAEFVDIIHTDTLVMGTMLPMGTVDFYVNGGNFQPGCDNVINGCNHQASHRYFFDTIPEQNREKYPAKKCDGIIQADFGKCDDDNAVANSTICYLGCDSPQCEPGLYYLKTDQVP